MNQPDALVAMVLIIWTIGWLLMVFRKDIDLVWKFCVLFILIFYLILNSSVLLNYFHEFEKGTIQVHNIIIIVFESALAWLPVFILLLWPITLFSSVFLLPKQAQSRIMLLTLVSLFYWIFWFLNSWLDLNMDQLIVKWLQDWKIPSLPQPPIQ